MTNSSLPANSKPRGPVRRAYPNPGWRKKAGEPWLQASVLGAVLGGNGSGIGDFLAQIHIFEQAALAVDGVKAEIEKKQDAENQKTGVFNFIRQI